MRPFLSHRRRRQRDRHQRGVGHGRVAGGRGRRELRHLPGAHARPGRADQRGAGPPRPLRHVRGAAGAFADFVGAATRCGRVRRRRRCGAIGRAHGATVGRRRTPITSWRSGAAAQLGVLHARGPEGVLGTLHIGVPGLHNAATRRWRRWRRSGGAPFEAAQARAGPLRRGEPALRVPRRGQRGDVRRRLRPPADRGAGRPGDGADRGWARIVAVFQPHRFSRTAALAAQFGSAFADADVLVVTDVYSAGERPVPGVSGRLVADAVTAQDPRLPGDLRPGGRSCARRWRRCCAPATSASRSGAGDLTALPDELLERPSGELPSAALRALAGALGDGRR